MHTRLAITAIILPLMVNCSPKKDGDSGASSASLLPETGAASESGLASASGTTSTSAPSSSEEGDNKPTTGGTEPVSGETETTLGGDETTSGEIETTLEGDGTTSGDTREPCSLTDQDCSDGMKCVPFASHGANLDSAHCIPVPPMPSALGQTCMIDSGYYSNQVDSCDAGGFCFYATLDLSEGVCVEFCDPAQGCADAGTHCSVLIDGGWLNLCTIMCDPLQPQSQCPEGGICAKAFASFDCKQKVDPDDEEFGQQCNGLYDCKPSLACVAPDNVPGCDGFCCTEYCDVNDPNACQAHPPQECVPFFEMDNQVWGHIGACLVP